jgi:hypothetical protein
MKDYKVLSQLGLKARWAKQHNKVYSHIKNNHSNLKLEKARLIGNIMGDGCITSIESHSRFPRHDIKFYPDDLNMANIFISDFEKLYLKKPKIKNAENYYKVLVSSKPAWKDLIDLTDFTSLNWKFPERILKSQEEKIEWLKSIFDCEGYVGQRRIQIQSISKGGIFSIKKLLEELEIKSSICIYQRKNPKWNKNYILTIFGKERLLTFYNLIGFSHAKKQEKLRQIAGVPER